MKRLCCLNALSREAVYAAWSLSTSDHAKRRIANPSPHPTCKLPFLGPDRVEIDRRRRCGGMAHPSLDEGGGNVLGSGPNTKTMAQAFRRGHWARDGGSIHCRLDEPPSRDAVALPQVPLAVGL
jgi:hypothetical protein